MSILKILENNNVSVEEYNYLLKLLKSNREHYLESIKKFNDTEKILEVIKIINPDFDESEDIKKSKEKALNSVEEIKNNLEMLNNLIKKLDL